MAEGEAMFRRNTTESGLEVELRGYLDTRDAAAELLSELLGGGPIRPEDEHRFLLEQRALLFADVEGVIDGREGFHADGVAERLRGFARQLEVRRSPNANVVELRTTYHSAGEQLEAADKLLLELRTARRAKIEELRSMIDSESDDEMRAYLVDECCPLLEEEIGSLRANGDEHMASMVSASLEVVRGMGAKRSRREVKEIKPTKDEKEWAHSVVAALVMTRDVVPDDVIFAEREAGACIVEGRGADLTEETIIRRVLGELRKRNYRGPRSVVDVDPREALVGGVLARA